MNVPMIVTEATAALGADEALEDLREVVAQQSAVKRGHLVLVVEDQPELSERVGPIADYVGLGVEVLPSLGDIGLALDEQRPMAVIAPFEMLYQDGGDILRTVAVHDRNLPVMLLVGRNPVYQGAAEALVELFNLTAASLPWGEPGFGDMVEFLARAAQNGRRRRLGGLAGIAEP